jgi:hypothetical protein
LKKSHSGNVQKNVVDVVVLAVSSSRSVVVLVVSSSRSDPILRRKWRRLRELHTYSAPTTPPSRSSEIWWSGSWDRQHDGVVSMVESIRRQGFACLRGGERTEKGGFRKRAAASQRTIFLCSGCARADPFISVVRCVLVASGRIRSVAALAETGSKSC